MFVVYNNIIPSISYIVIQNAKQKRAHRSKVESRVSMVWHFVIVITQDEYDILVITRIRGEAEDEC